MTLVMLLLSTLFGYIHKKVVNFMNQRPFFVNLLVVAQIRRTHGWWFWTKVSMATASVIVTEWTCPPYMWHFSPLPPIHALPSRLFHHRGCSLNATATYTDDILSGRQINGSHLWGGWDDDKDCFKVWIFFWTVMFCKSVIQQNMIFLWDADTTG